MLKAAGFAAARAILWLSLAGACAGEDFIAGIGTHSTTREGLALIRQAGIPSLRDDIHWAEVEREKGVLAMPERYDRYVDDALRLGIEPVLILCYGNKFHDGGSYPLSAEASEAYARFAEFVVGHFKGRVHKFEIWNEWNIAISLPKGTPRGGPLEYVGLLRKVYPRLKAIDPGITVIGGALSGNAVAKGWLENACQAGLLDNLDAFSFHPYCYREGAEARLPENGFVKLIRDSQEVTRRYQKREIPIYITEVGWPNHRLADGSTPEDTARFLERTFLLARTMPFIRGLWWYDFRDDGPDPDEREHHFGIVSADLTPKPAYHAMAAICALFKEARYDGEVTGVPGAHILKFRRDSGETVFVLWSRDEAGPTVPFEAGGASAPVARLTELGGGAMPCGWARRGSLWELSVPLSGTPRVLEPGALSAKVSGVE